VGFAMSQLSLLPEPEFFPILPPANTAAAQALHDLCAGDLTQIDWLQSGNGWRLAAAVKELGYLGWEPVSILVKAAGWKRPIARYSLTQRALQAVFTLRQKGGKHASE